MAGIPPGSPAPPPGPQPSILPSPPRPGAPTPAPTPPLSPDWWEQVYSRYPRRTRRLIAFGIILLPTVALLAALLIAGRSAPSSSAQSPSSQANVTVQLLSASCRTDRIRSSCGYHFYVLGMLVAPVLNAPTATPSVQVVVTPPMKIRGGADSPFNPVQTVFKSNISASAMVMGGFIAYDDMEGLDVSKLSLWSQMVAMSVSTQLKAMSVDSENVSRVPTRKMLDLAAQAWFATAGLTSSSTPMLGQPQPLTLPATGPMSEQPSVSFMRKPASFIDEGVDYTLHYQITRVPVAAALARQAQAPVTSEQEALTRRAPARILLATTRDVAPLRRIFFNPDIHLERQANDV